MIWRRLPSGIGRNSTRRWAGFQALAVGRPFLELFNKAHLLTFGDVFQAWMISQIPGGTEGLEQLVCDGKTLRGSAVETEDGSHRYGLRPTA